MLKVLVLAPGRSGTTSLTTLIQDLCTANGCDWVVKHQTEQGPLTVAAADSVMRNDNRKAREILGNWTHQVEVSGNQNAFIVPVFRELFGDDLKIIRLKRDRDTHLKSLLTGPKVAPEVWGGYHDNNCDYKGPVYWQLPIAPWFGEMSEAEWGQLPVEARVGWYLTTLQAWMDREASGFEQRITVRTEELNDLPTIDRIARFLNPAWTERVQAVHKNSRGMFDYSKLTYAQAQEAKRVWSSFDFNRALNDPAYLLLWAIEKTTEVADDPDHFLGDLEQYVRGLREKAPAV